MFFMLPRLRTAAAPEEREEGDDLAAYAETELRNVTRYNSASPQQRALSALAVAPV